MPKIEHALAAAAAGDSKIQDLVSQIGLLVIGAALAFAFGLASDKLKARRDPRKRISYSLNVESGMATVSSALKDRVSVTYAGAPIVGQIYQVTCLVQNTGTQLVKDEYLRFSFPTNVVILEAGPSADSPPEMGIEEDSGGTLATTDRRWQISHFERDQKCLFRFTVAGPSPDAPIIYPFNEEGGVEFTPTAVSLADDVTSHVRPLIAIALVAWFIPNLNFFFFIDIGSAVNAIIGFVLLILALPHIAPVASLVSQLVRRRLLAEDQVARVQIRDSANFALSVDSSDMTSIHVDEPDLPPSDK